jgi:hypothetical protein
MTRSQLLVWVASHMHVCGSIAAQVTRALTGQSEVTELLPSGDALTCVRTAVERSRWLWCLDTSSSAVRCSPLTNLADRLELPATAWLSHSAVVFESLEIEHFVAGLLDSATEPTLLGMLAAHARSSRRAAGYTWHGLAAQADLYGISSSTDDMLVWAQEWYHAAETLERASLDALEELFARDTSVGKTARAASSAYLNEQVAFIEALNVALDCDQRLVDVAGARLASSAHNDAA